MCGRRYRFLWEWEKSHHLQFLLSMLFKVKYESHFVPIDAMKAYWVVEVFLHFFLKSARDGYEYFASRHSRKYFQGKSHWIREEKRKIIVFPGFKTQFLSCPACELVTTLTEVYWGSNLCKYWGKQRKPSGLQMEVLRPSACKGGTSIVSPRHVVQLHF